MKGGLGGPCGPGGSGGQVVQVVKWLEKSAIEGGRVRRIVAKVMKNTHFFGRENIPKWQCLSLGLSVVANFQSGCSEHLSVIKEACGPTNIWSELQLYKGTNIPCIGMTIDRKGEGFPQMIFDITFEEEGNLAKWLQRGQHLSQVSQLLVSDKANLLRVTSDAKMIYP